MTTKAPGRGERGPFRADQIKPGDRYELSDGHPVYCAPAGRRHARSNAMGGAVVGFDPDVEEVGVDAGYSSEPGNLRAPDVAVGNVPDAPGWVSGAPGLAIEYADTGQDAQELADKIRDLLDAGTRYVWVVHLVGPRRVDVHASGEAVRTVLPGDALAAPGVLKNAVPVEALYDRSAAARALLINLLQREGYENLDAVRIEGRVEGRVEGLRSTVRDLCELLGIDLDAERQRAIDAMGEPALDTLRVALKRDRRWPDAP